MLPSYLYILDDIPQYDPCFPNSVPSSFRPVLAFHELGLHWHPQWPQGCSHGAIGRPCGGGIMAGNPMENEELNHGISWVNPPFFATDVDFRCQFHEAWLVLRLFQLEMCFLCCMIWAPLWPFVPWFHHKSSWDVRHTHIHTHTDGNIARLDSEGHVFTGTCSFSEVKTCTICVARNYVLGTDMGRLSKESLALSILDSDIHMLFGSILSFLHIVNASFLFFWSSE